MHEHLMAHGVHVPAISRPFYMPKGEFRVMDPDGYCLMVAQGN